MTAYELLRSLVGSEMCIRDSHHTNLKGTGVIDPRLAKVFPARMSNIKINDAGAIVDYEWARDEGVDVMYGTRRIYGALLNATVATAPVAKSYTIANSNDKDAIMAFFDQEGFPYTVDGNVVKVTYPKGCMYINTNDYNQIMDLKYVNLRALAVSQTGGRAENDTYFYPSSSSNAVAGTGSFWSRPDSDSDILTYYEMCFIKAEVNMRMGNAAAAYTAYIEGINASFNRMQTKLQDWAASGTTNPDQHPMSQTEINAYLASAAVAKNASQLTMADIMLQKTIAMGINMETWNDMRRFNYGAGNIANFEGAALTYQNGAHKHAVTHVGGVQKYWYDANGNATRRINGSQDITLTYDAENRLTAMSGGVASSYVYDADGNRVKETIAGVTRVFVGSYYEIDNGTVKKYYYAGATRVAESSGGVLYYLLTDHLGSTALTLDSSGVRVTELRYYPFGAARYNAGNQVTTYRFTGQRWDSGTALYFYQSRWYDPLIGRFLAADTIVPQPQNPQNLNRYSYVGNQPLGFIDPSGHAAICGTSVDDGCGGIDALHSIELQLRRGRLDPIGAKQAYYQYYLAHPGENAGAYQPLNPTEEFNGIISTGYAQAQAELGAANLGGLALGAATTNGVIFEAMSGYGGNAALGMMAMVGGIGTGGSICLNCGTVKPDLARSSGKLRIDPDGASVYCTNCLKNGQTKSGPNKYWVKSFEG